MLTKYFKIFIFVFFLFHQDLLYSKNNNLNEINSKNLSNYFYALVSYDNNKNTEALKFFNLSKPIIKKHKPYLKQYIFSLIVDGQIHKAIKELKNNETNENVDFFEAYLLLALENIKKGNFLKGQKYLNKLLKFTENNTFELIIYESLSDFLYLFENKKIRYKKNNLGNLTLINRAFQGCYINNNNTETYFINLINNSQVDHTRYIFFYVVYLIDQGKFKKAQEITNQIEPLNSNLLILQAKDWIDNNKFKNFTKVFSCKNEKDILSEFIFLIGNIYSNQKNFEKSNFYLNLSNYLNPDFIFNSSLLAENHYNNKNYKQSERIINKFNKNNETYYWYRLKKKAHILSKEVSEEESFNFINLKFQKINNPSIKMIFDMANIAKAFKKYEIAIKYYDLIISQSEFDLNIYADLLYRRGASYERVGKYNKSDNDFLKSLKINPDDAYVLNYLAYSWLERGYKIEKAIKMLEKAYHLKKNDPFILDSVGWGYYLVNDFINAEKFLRRAIEIMPNDPTVNDHYGDILWRMNEKIQAKYYWQSVLNFENTENNMKKDIKLKILNGLKEL